MVGIVAFLENVTHSFQRIEFVHGQIIFSKIKRKKKKTVNPF